MASRDFLETASYLIIPGMTTAVYYMHSMYIFGIPTTAFHRDLRLES
jgi:hypothetical protein